MHLDSKNRGKNSSLRLIMNRALSLSREGGEEKDLRGESVLLGRAC